MPATRFVVNYSAATGRVRSITVFPEANEDDSHLDSVRVGPGERQLRLPMERYGNHLQVQEVVSSITGFIPDDLHDCFDEHGAYVTSINCDPLCGDGPPLGCAAMVKSVGARPSDKLVAGELVRPVVVKPPLDLTR